MNLHRSFSTVLAVSTSFALASAAHAGLNASNHSQWDQDHYYNGFGGAAPAGLVESSVGFSTIGNYDGRVISNAAITTNTTDASILTTINTRLFGLQDTNLYQFTITNPSTFSASIPSTTLLLGLFSSDGTALALSKGGVALNAANSGVTAAGTYYIGIATPTNFPQNTAGIDLFPVDGSSAAGVYAAAAIADLKLSTDPYNAWTNPGGSSGSLLGNTSFFASGSNITLAGSNFAVVPEPASIALFGLAGLAAVARRRTRA